MTKDADWWGDRIYRDVARRPTGPWTTVRMLDASVANDEENNYFASIITVSEGEVVIGLSHNRWDGVQSAIYRPTFESVPLAEWVRPPVLGARRPD